MLCGSAVRQLALAQRVHDGPLVRSAEQGDVAGGLLVGRGGAGGLERVASVSGHHGGELGERLGARTAWFGVVEHQRLVVGVGDRQLLVAQLYGTNLRMVDW